MGRFGTPASRMGPGRGSSDSGSLSLTSIADLWVWPLALLASTAMQLLLSRLDVCDMSSHA